MALFSQEQILAVPPPPQVPRAQAPQSKLVRLLGTPATQLAQVLGQRQEKLGEKS